MQHPHPKLFKLSDNASQDLPVYVLRDGNLFRTAFHPQGWSDQPDYSLETDGKFYRTSFHEDGTSSAPDYEFGSNQFVYRAQGHPLGKDSQPAFELKD
ncbi:MAG: hypothetical protein MI892_15955 [Desulfobacterales bacterium]|nr:hypothetical protein [Desulfobacterales bacterium]